MPALKLATATPNVGDLENAGRVIKEHLQADAARVPELDVALATSGKGSPCCYSRWLTGCCEN